MDKWLSFYREHLLTEGELVIFIEACEQLKPLDQNHRAKIMMHQGQRLLTIAEGMESVEDSREPLKLLFLLIAAENISKLHVSTKESGKSKFHVRRFFNEFCSNEDKEKIVCGIEIDGEKSSFEQLIDVLYDIRCDLVHEGTYWGFDFATPKNPSILTGINPGQVIRVKMYYEEFRDIVARGIVCATQQVIGYQLRSKKTNK